MDLESLATFAGTLLASALAALAARGRIYGTGSHGPGRTLAATVIKTWVDRSLIGSHYMVATDAGVFEVANGIGLGVCDADELFGQLVEGKRYMLAVIGKRAVGPFMQSYPYIVSAPEISTEPTAPAQR